MAKYYNPQIETAPRHELSAWQGLNLSRTVRRVYDSVPLYRERMQQAGLTPDDIKSVSDLKKLPFTTKADLRDTYPYGLFATDMSNVIRLHASSGTTGKQIVVGYTQKDIDIWSECAARSLVCVGGTKDDFVHVSYGYGLFTGGLGMHYGAEKLGATVIPASSGNTARQVSILQDFGSSIICCTPSYALYICDVLKQGNIPPSSLKLKAGIFGAEPWTENMRREIEEKLEIKAYDIYGLSEIIGPGVACECECQKGMHINEDHFIPEIIDPDTGEVLPEGSKGELVFTCITKEAFPLIRYRTRDISSLTYDKCDCGRTLVRMTKPDGRSDDMLIIRGVNVFPSQIESVLLSLGDVAPHYMLIVDRVNNSDTLEIQVEMSDTLFSDEVRRLDEVKNRIRREVESTLGIAATVTLVEPKAIARSEGKAKRVIDKRVLI